MHGKLIARIRRNKDIPLSQLLLHLMKLGKGDITDYILIVIGNIVLADIIEVEQSKILCSSVAIIYAERVVGSISWKLRVIALLILILIVIEASSDIAQYS
jgi:hypothetical protein